MKRNDLVEILVSLYIAATATTDFLAVTIFLT